MADKAKKGSWADDTEEETPVVNAWSKGNPWGTSVESKGPVQPPSEKEYPSPNKTVHEEPRSNQRDNRDRESQDYRRQDNPREYSKDRDNFNRDTHSRDSYQRDSYNRDSYSRDQRDKDSHPRDRVERDSRENFQSRDRENFQSRDRERGSIPRESYNRGGFDEGARRSYGRGGGYRNEHDDRERFSGRDQRDSREQREPREQKERPPVPFPTEAPFTAFVGNLPFNVNEQDLSQFFEADCKVINVRLLVDRDQKPKGFGYVEFEDLESLKNAITRSGEILAGRDLRIDVASAKPDDRRKNDIWSKPYRNEKLGPKSSEETEEERKERKKIELKPRTVDATPTGVTTSDAYQKSQKANPFGEAKPRDENAALKKKEEERKQRDGDGKKDTNEENSEKSSEDVENSPSQEKQERDKDNKSKEDRRRENKPREDRSREDRGPREPREDRGPREPREDRGPRDDRSIGRGRGMRTDDKTSRRDNGKSDRPRDDKPRDDRPRERDDRSRDRDTRSGPRRDDKRDEKTNKPGFARTSIKEDKPQKKESTEYVNPYGALIEQDE